MKIKWKSLFAKIGLADEEVKSSADGMFFPEASVDQLAEMESTNKDLVASLATAKADLENANTAKAAAETALATANGTIGTLNTKVTELETKLTARPVDETTTNPAGADAPKSESQFSWTQKNKVNG